jgi:predicted peptidase
MLLGARPALATGRPNGHGAWYYPHVAGPQGVVYSLYIPDRYSPNRGGYPMVLFCSSNSVDQGWGYWHTIIETLGVIYAAPLNAGNNVPATRRIEMVALTLADVRKRVNIDPNRTYCSGFSGGGKVASEVAFSFAPYFGGVIPVSGSEVVEPLDASQARLSVAIITGSADFNQKYEVANSQRDRQVGLRTRLWP